MLARLTEIVRYTFADSGSETYVPILLLQLLLFLAFRIWRRRNGKPVWPRLFANIRSRSTILDVLFIALNHVPVVGSFGFVQRRVADLIQRTLPNSEFVGSVLHRSGGLRIAIATAVVVVATDLGLFVAHVIQHRFRVLWVFHSVHHGAPTMTPLTATRTHPVETMLGTLIASTVAGAVVGTWITLFDSSLTTAHFLGANVVYFGFHVAFASARHSSIPISFGPLERFIVSPRMHQLHHSIDPAHHDLNFGSILSIWDRMLGTHIRTMPELPLRFGMNGKSGTSVREALVTPFAELMNVLRNPRTIASGPSLKYRNGVASHSASRGRTQDEALAVPSREDEDEPIGVEGRHNVRSLFWRRTTRRTSEGSEYRHSDTSASARLDATRSVARSDAQR